MPSSDDQADIDAAFSAMTAGEVARAAPRLSDENPAHGRLIVTGADAATMEQFTRLSGRWQRGELSLEELAEQMQRGKLPD
jgi:hypothetical protein